MTFSSGCYKITTVFSHAQTVVLCVGCSTVLCQPTGGKARLTEGMVFLALLEKDPTTFFFRKQLCSLKQYFPSVDVIFFRSTSPLFVKVMLSRFYTVRLHDISHAFHSSSYSRKSSNFPELEENRQKSEEKNRGKKIVF